MLTGGPTHDIFHVMFRIFDKLGGIEPTLDVIQRRRKMKSPRRLTMRAVQDWKARKAIPPVNAVLLMAECRDRGIPFDWNDCLLPVDTKKDAAA